MSNKRRDRKHTRPEAGGENSFSPIDGNLRSREVQNSSGATRDAEAHDALPIPPYDHCYAEMAEEALKVNAAWLDETPETRKSGKASAQSSRVKQIKPGDAAPKAESRKERPQMK